MNKKYRLKIKYPIPEKYGKDYVEIVQNNNEVLTEYTDCHKCRDGYKTMIVRGCGPWQIPSDWIEEIEEQSEFYKWKNSSPENTFIPIWFSENQLINYKDFINEQEGTQMKAWEASEKKTHELYRGLLRLCEHVGTTNNRCFVENIKNEVEKIKESLPDNAK